MFKQIDRLYRDGTFTAQGDGQLLDRYLVYRDEGAFEAIVNLHGPMVLSLCRRFLRDPRDIEDAFQATFLVLARKAGSIRNREVLSSWLYGVAYRIAVRSRSEVLKRRSLETGITVLDDHAGAAARDVDEIGPVLDQELNRLPEKYRAPIVLCYLKEQTHDQAAAALRWPVGTVRSRLARGRELLKQRLTRRGCSPATAMLLAGPGGSFRSFTAAVPQSLVQATVESAGRYLWGVATGAVPGVLAISSTSSPSLSGSVTALAQGVLLTMSLSQFKFVAAGVTAAGLLAGGLGVGAMALGKPGPVQQAGTPALEQKPAENAPAKTIVESVQKPAVAGPVLASPSARVEARLADLERKLDLLLRRLNPPHPSPDTLPPPRQQGPQETLENPLPTGTSPFEMDRPESLRPQRQPEPKPQRLPASPIAASDLPPDAPPEQPNETPPGYPTPPFIEANGRPEAGQPVARTPSGGTLPPLPSVNAPGSDVVPVPSPPGDEVPPLSSARIPQEQEVRAPAPPRGEPSMELTKVPQVARSRTDPFDSLTPTRSSLNEIEVQIQIARQHFERNKALYAAAAIGKQTYDEPLDQIRLLIARLEGMGEDYSDELERLKLESLKKQAELKMAEAEHEATTANIATHTRLNHRKPGTVSPEEMIKAESENVSTSARVEVKRAELRETGLRISQVDRRLETIKRVANEVLKAIPEIARKHGPPPAQPGLQ